MHTESLFRVKTIEDYRGQNRLRMHSFFHEDFAISKSGVGPEKREKLLLERRVRAAPMEVGEAREPFNLCGWAMAFEVTGPLQVRCGSEDWRTKEVKDICCKTVIC